MRSFIKRNHLLIHLLAISEHASMTGVTITNQSTVRTVAFDDDDVVAVALVMMVTLTAGAGVGARAL